MCRSGTLPAKFLSSNKPLQMDLKTCILALLMSFSFPGCQQLEVKQYLTGDWQYDLAAIRIEMDLRGSGFAERNYMESIMAGLQFATLGFLEKGRVQFELDSLRQTGDWKLKKNGKQLMIRLTEKPQQYAIERRGRDTLLLDPLNGEGLAFPRMLIRKQKE